MSNEFYLLVSNYLETADFASFLAGFPSFLPIFYLSPRPGAASANFSNDSADCYGGGRYCNPDPDGAEGNQTGKDVLDEMLRQKCLFNLGLVSPKFKDVQVKQFWVYAAKFYPCLVDIQSRKSPPGELFGRFSFQGRQIEKMLCHL